MRAFSRRITPCESIALIGSASARVAVGARDTSGRSTFDKGDLKEAAGRGSKISYVAVGVEDLRVQPDIRGFGVGGSSWWYVRVGQILFHVRTFQRLDVNEAEGGNVVNRRSDLELALFPRLDLVRRMSSGPK
jgi:hypothetical protein